MNRMLEIRVRVAQYGLALAGADPEALDMARGNLEVYAYSDLRYLLADNARLTADIAAMTAERDALINVQAQLNGVMCGVRAERDAFKARAEAAEQYIRDMLYDATLLVDSAMCDFCDRWENDLCWAGDCKAECKMRGPAAGKEEKDGSVT